ncbi:hypothetical protein PHYSODRAFT_505374 [Phytophthora sojae]|uniref:BRCT domain-containing protein n=1 Tax=Phytophthora sojae (strain P6497) TaxID=1094619 RepID=G4ZP30_PHYSP|nr:hypothetical protein PHYSODRAFT_505374 [Phytophthora sojae]EGZ16107.1 hypothetical protein PHYSODRAFT_505374 [Phytophthora sojae]|eukprot:XP_009529856.1 hypothetical protein PHYSODRAFT_505374 [Phytophthora sojae]
MREQWEAVQAGLRVFLEEESAYVQFLANIEQELARKLRFEARSRDGSLVDSDFDRFVETAAQLQYLHVLFHSKLKPFAEPRARGDVSPADDKCSRFVETLADMLSVLRILYGRLFCRGDSTQAVIEKALTRQDKDSDGTVVENFLAKQQLTAEKLVARPLKRFDELVEFVEALSKALSEDDSDEIMSNNSESGCEEKLNYAPQLMHIAQENKHYIHIAKADAREESELIALQTCFHGDGADELRDLSSKKLLLHGGVFLSVWSAQNGSGSGASFTIKHCLHLKQDSAFLEFVPASVPVLESTGEARALALIRQDTTLLLAWNDAATNSTPPREFVSFYDDQLPGVFWLAPENDSKTSEEWWQVVEIVSYAKWLLVFKLDGWKGHSLLCQLDTRMPGVEICEQPRGDKEWSLVISPGSAASITLVSKKRTRIDFWFDQVWKAVESAQIAARRAERERKEREEMEEEEAHVRVDGSKQAGTKRKLATCSSDQSPSEHMKKAQEPRSNSSSAASSGSKPDDKTDDECGDLEKSATANCVEEEQAAALSAKKRPRRSSDRSSKKTPSAAPTGKDDKSTHVATPPVKTPKRRWLMRKSDDPNDTDLIPTQPSQSIPTDESMSETDATQLPGNEVQVGVEATTQEVRIILTGVEPTASIRKKIDSISGAVYEEDIEKATHVLAPKNQLKRTVKLLCGISRCAHVLDVRWLDESARVGAPIYERAHCLKDAKAEAKWQFDLRKTMYDFTPEQRRQLFAGHKVFITNHKSVLPPVKDLVKIVECAGGTAVTKGSAGPDDVVITSEAALGMASVRKALAQANPQRIYSAELILSGILQQHIDFDKNRLEQPGGGNRRRR